MSQLRIRYRAYGWYCGGVRWDGGACPLEMTINSENWYPLDAQQRDDTLARYTKMQHPEVERIDHVAIQSID